MIRKADAIWKGSLKEGLGTVKLGSGKFEGNYSFSSRFEKGEGTNPEELIGAAHAGCFSMALSLMLSDEGNEPEEINTTAEVDILPDKGGFAIKSINLKTKAKVPGIDKEQFLQYAKAAKENCPVSKALKGVDNITLDAELV